MVNTNSQWGMYGWVVDGINQLYQKWFWYRIGSDGLEQPINTLPLISAVPQGSNILTIKYGNPTFEITVIYTLTGGLPGSGTSDIGEVIRIDNLSSSSLDLHFFQYSDFDLNDTPWNDFGALLNPYTIAQWEPGFILSETTGVPAASRFEIGFYPNIIDRLNDDNPTNLSNGTSPSGPGDITWAWQWDMTLGAKQSLIISKDKYLKTVVPEPGTLILLGTGLSSVGLFSRRIKL